MYIVIDFETASPADLKRCGAWKYAEHPLTEIICLGYSIDGGPAKVLTPADLADEDTRHELWQAVDVSGCLFIAHNVAFEKAIWRNIMVPLFGWPDIPNARWHDSQATCAMKALPLRLDKVAAVLKLAHQKGSFNINSLSKLRKDGTYDRSPETLAKAYTYNGGDIDAEVELNHRVGGLQSCERPVWLLDQRINERGVRVDLEYVGACQRIVDGASVPLVAEFCKITSGVKPSQRDKVVQWVRGQGVDLPNLQKDTITKLLGAEDEEEDDNGEDNSTTFEPALLDLSASVRRALKIRRSIGSASIKKLAAIRSAACADSRVRGVVQYHGAGPGRWVGRLFQPQNFPRDSNKWDKDDKHAIDPEIVCSILGTGDHELVAALLGEPIDAVVKGLRHSIIASPGRTLTVGDFETIECRIVLALAGQHDRTARIAAGEKPYIPMAEAIFGRKIDKEKDLKEYTIGKNTVLGCGFQMGASKFHSRYCPDQPLEFAQRAIDTYRKEWAPLVPKVWHGLEDAALRAVWDKRTTEAYGVRYAHEDMWLTARLPSGRKLYYANPRPIRKAMTWDATDVRPAWTCQAWKMGRWITRDMYGGLETENVVQALARDLMVAAMFKCEKEKLPVVLTVHDEIVCEPLEKDSDPVMLRQIMSDAPEWARSMQIPVSAECWSGGRYKK